jgi:hypothetical protein
MLSMLSLIMTALPAGAAGPYDGIWFVIQHCPSVGIVRTLPISVTENDAFGTYWGATFNMVLFVLDPVTGSWNVDFATRHDNTIQGQVFDSFGTQQGTFTTTANSLTSITGTADIEGVSCSLTGTRVF